MAIFEDRERAAEYGFTHSQELDFLADRQGVAKLGLWAADRMAFDEVLSESYVSALIGRFVAGAGEAELLSVVQGDLERNGQAMADGNLGRLLDRAVAEASDRLHGRDVRPASAPPHGRQLQHHRHGFWGWTV